MTINVTQSESEQKIRLIQITDPHLFKDEKGELLGINTQQSFLQVLSEIQAQNRPFDFVLATGDLVQDGTKEGYQRFCDFVKVLQKPVYWIPGNHDFQPNMAEILNNDQDFIRSEKHFLIGEKWQIILLDSQVYGVPHGELSQYQLDWLDEKLQENQERYSLIVLHHHLLSTNSLWLDQHNLRNAHQLAAVLGKYENIAGILHGHIHQQVDTEWNSYPLFCTPSTCVQFKPDNNAFTLDDLQPGWREITLLPNGKIETQVYRIKNTTFLPNYQEDGY